MSLIILKNISNINNTNYDFVINDNINIMPFNSLTKLDEDLTLELISYIGLIDIKLLSIYCVIDIVLNKEVINIKVNDNNIKFNKCIYEKNTKIAYYKIKLNLNLQTYVESKSNVLLNISTINISYNNDAIKTTYILQILKERNNYYKHLILNNNNNNSEHA